MFFLNMKSELDCSLDSPIQQDFFLNSPSSMEDQLFQQILGNFSFLLFVFFTDQIDTNRKKILSQLSMTWCAL